MKNKTVIIALIYMLSPIDVVPDAIPVVGTLDDAWLFLASIANTLEHYHTADLTTKDGIMNVAISEKNVVDIVNNNVHQPTNVIVDVPINEKSVIAMKCPNCGCEVSKLDLFCPECGIKL